MTAPDAAPLPMTSETGPPVRPSERKFGYTFAVLCSLLAAWLGWRGSTAPVVAGLVCAAAGFALAAARAPRLLAPLNAAWFGLGLLLGRLVSPLVLGAMFFLLITPIAWAMRVAGRDALRLRRDRAAPVDSYWIARDPPGPEPGSFRNPF
jgi:hypothetical protein